MEVKQAKWERCSEPTFKEMIELSGTVHTGERDVIRMQVLAYDNGFGLLLIFRKKWMFGEGKSIWERLV